MKLDKLRKHHLRDWRKRLEETPALITRNKKGEKLTKVRSASLKVSDFDKRTRTLTIGMDKRTWIAEQTNFPGEVTKAALAHQNRNHVERAYQRGAQLEKRRKLMDAWGAYCNSGRGKVPPFKSSAAR